METAAEWSFVVGARLKPLSFRKPTCKLLDQEIPLPGIPQPLDLAPANIPPPPVVLVDAPTARLFSDRTALSWLLL